MSRSQKPEFIFLQQGALRMDEEITGWYCNQSMRDAVGNAIVGIVVLRSGQAEMTPCISKEEAFNAAEMIKTYMQGSEVVICGPQVQFPSISEELDADHLEDVDAERFKKLDQIMKDDNPVSPEQFEEYKELAGKIMTAKQQQTKRNEYGH